jgi:arginyl-tRNA synthetase
MRERLEEHLRSAVRCLLDEVGDMGEIPTFGLERSRQREHGDFACNAAMVLAKRLRRPPREIAGRLVESLGDASGLVARAEIAGPGFVNLWLSGDRWREVVRQILTAGENFGGSRTGEGRRVQVEFVSANPTGPLSIGHGRQAVLGDSIARVLLDAGYDVTREYYFNDGGRQMRVLGDSVKARYLEQLGRAAPPPEGALEDPEAPWPEVIDGLPVVFPRDGYRGDYIGEIAAALREHHGEALVEEPGEGCFREEAEARIFREIRSTLESLGIHFDVYYNERSLYQEGKIEETLADLRSEQLLFDSEGAVWLRGTAFGLERDRVLVKGTGEPTYLLPDIAYHREKFRRGFETVINVMGADHIDQFPFVRQAIRALGCEPERLELVMHQFVTLTRGGETVKQSTRAGTFITIDEVVEEVGVDVFRFFMVQRTPERHLNFDLDLAKETDWTKNPAYYLQYAHARTHGIEREAARRGVAIPAVDEIDIACLVLPEEIELIKKLSEFPEVMLCAAETREPHHISYYLRELAELWNPYIQDGKRHRVLSEDAALTGARLGLTLAVRTVLAKGLGLLGMSAPERM